MENNNKNSATDLSDKVAWANAWALTACARLDCPKPGRLAKRLFGQTLRDLSRSHSVAAAQAATAARASEMIAL